MPAYTDELDIANRALQHLRRPRISSFTNRSKEAVEIASCFERLREAELEANLWRFSTRRALLRPVDVDSAIWTPVDWAAGAFDVGDVRAYTPTSGTRSGIPTYWQAAAIKTSASTTTPDLDPDWRVYAGAVMVDLYDSSITYSAGDVVLVPQEWDISGSYTINAVVRVGTTWYVSLVDGINTGNEVTDTTKWAVWSSTGRADGSFGLSDTGVPVTLHYTNFTIHLSLYNQNTDNPVDANVTWLQHGGTIANLRLVYPIGAGPASDQTTRNVYRLPYGFLRMAPQDPKADAYPVLGVPSGLARDDFVNEAGYIVSATPTALLIRYVADLVNVRDMDALFCEMLAASIAKELAPDLVGDEKLLPILTSRAEREYKTWRRKALAANAIEIGPIAPYIDDLILVRL